MSQDSNSVTSVSDSVPTTYTFQYRLHLYDERDEFTV